MTTPQAVTFSRVAALRAIRAGAQAARDGRDVIACPWRVTTTPTERALARYWIRGYEHARAGRPGHPGA